MGYLHWDPDRAMCSFHIPFLDRPILWYGFFFALGFFLGYWITVYLLRRYFLQFPEYGQQLKQGITQVVDRLTVYMVLGTLIGARLGDLLFYQDWVQFKEDPFSVLKIWEGGLASHGAAVGILVSLLLYARKMQRTCAAFTFWRVLDFVVIPTALGCALIRIGNFFNQEILGTVTSVPWGVVFGHAADGGPRLPRHPAQLYEAACLLAVFIVLIVLWNKGRYFAKEGGMAGLFLVGVFVCRFWIEFIKVEQSVYLAADSLLTMGQYLSIPFVALGAYLLMRNPAKVKLRA